MSIDGEKGQESGALRLGEDREERFSVRSSQGQRTEDAELDHCGPIQPSPRRTLLGHAGTTGRSHLLGRFQVRLRCSEPQRLALTIRAPRGCPNHTRR